MTDRKHFLFSNASVGFQAVGEWYRLQTTQEQSLTPLRMFSAKGHLEVFVAKDALGDQAAFEEFLVANYAGKYTTK